MRKGQVGLEYVMLIGVLMTVVIPLFYFASTKSTESIKYAQADDTVHSLARAADEVYALSPGSKKYVWVTIPGSVETTQVGSSEISLRMKYYGNSGDIVASTKAQVTGDFPEEKGTYRIAIEHLDSGQVQIGSGNDTAAPTITSTSPTGLNCNPITLQVTTNEPSSCKFGSNDSSYSSMPTTMSGSSLGHTYSIGVQTAGNYTYYSRCSDAFDNTMQTSTTINYAINLSLCSTESNSSNSSGNLGNGPLTDLGIDNGFYFKTTGDLTDNDNEMASWYNITLDLLDDDINTPSNSKRIRYKDGNVFEGYALELREEASDHTVIYISGRLDAIDFSPYNVSVYGYLPTGDVINTTKVVTYLVNDSILQQKVKWVEFEITDVARIQDGFGTMKFRFTSTSLAGQLNKQLHFSEIHIKVG